MLPAPRSAGPSMRLKIGQRDLARRSLDSTSGSDAVVGLLPATPSGRWPCNGRADPDHDREGRGLVLNSVLVSRVADRTVMDMRRIFYRAALRMDQPQFDRIGATRS